MRYFIPFEHHYCGRERTERVKKQRERVVKRQGNRQRGSLVHPYQFLSGHTSQHDGHKSQDAREEPSTDPKRGGGLCFYASHLTLKEKKTNKTLLRRLSKSAAKTRAQPEPSWQPSAPGGPPPLLRLPFPRGCRVARASAEGQSLSAPPLMTSGERGGAWPPRGFPAPAVGASFLSA